MPAVDNERKRMMSRAEQTVLDAALLDCRNALVAPVVTRAAARNRDASR